MTRMEAKMEAFAGAVPLYSAQSFLRIRVVYGVFNYDPWLRGSPPWLFTAIFWPN